MVAQDGAQGCCCGDINLSELSWGHLALGALAEVDSTQRQRQSPQAAALRQLSYKDKKKTYNNPLWVNRQKPDLILCFTLFPDLLAAAGSADDKPTLHLSRSSLPLLPRTSPRPGGPASQRAPDDADSSG